MPNDKRHEKSITLYGDDLTEFKTSFMDSIFEIPLLVNGIVKSILSESLAGGWSLFMESVVASCVRVSLMDVKYVWPCEEIGVEKSLVDEIFSIARELGGFIPKAPSGLWHCHLQLKTNHLAGSTTLCQSSYWSYNRIGRVLKCEIPHVSHYAQQLRPHALN